MTSPCAAQVACCLCRDFRGSSAVRQCRNHSVDDAAGNCLVGYMCTAHSQILQAGAAEEQANVIFITSYDSRSIAVHKGVVSGQDKVLPWDHHPPRAFSGTVPDKISSVSVILQEIKQAFQTQENQGVWKSSWWKPGDPSSTNLCSAMLISLVWKMTSFTFTNLSLFCTCRIVFKHQLILTSDSESSTDTARKFSH